MVFDAHDVVHFHYGLAVLDRLLSTPPRGEAVTDPSLPHTANSADGTFTRLSTAFTGARLSRMLLPFLTPLLLTGRPPCGTPGSMCLPVKPLGSEPKGFQSYRANV